MSAYAAPSLLFGAGFALLAQAIFIGADTGDAVPRLGMAVLTLGVALFALGAFARAKDADSDVPRSWLPDAILVAAFVGLFIALVVHDMRDWYYSAIGDEYAFYLSAMDVTENGVKVVCLVKKAFTASIR